MPIPRGARLRNRLSELARLRGVLQVLVRHGFGSLVDQLGFGDATKPPPPDFHSRLGRRLTLALTDLGPTFVKLGQVLSTRDDVLPPAITTELASLQQDVRPVPVAAIRHEMALALGRPVDQLFARFDPVPLASASMAQVHRATTLDGQEVVCKVRRPGIVARVDEDLALLHTIAELAHQRVEELRRYDPQGLFGAFATALRRELDFRHEAEALVRMADIVGRTAVVPELRPDLSGERVITMSWLDGEQLDDVTETAARKDLARQLLRTFVRQILRGGMFHADPHPGNLRVVDGRIALLDFGAVGEFTDTMRHGLVSIATAAAERDGHALATALLPVLSAPGPADLDAYQHDVGAFLEGLLARDLGAVRFRDLSVEVWMLSRRHELQIRPAYLQLLRTVVILDGVLDRLDPGLDAVREARVHIVGQTVAREAERAAHTVRAAIPAPVGGVAAGFGITAALIALAWWLIAG